MSNKGHILVDLDRTLAHYDTPRGPLDIGKPIAPMVARILKWLSDDKDVRIFTGRINVPDEELRKTIVTAIEIWCVEHVGCPLPVTCSKDMDTLEIWDDTAIAVEPNTGKALLRPSVGFSGGAQVPK